MKNFHQPCNLFKDKLIFYGTLLKNNFMRKLLYLFAFTVIFTSCEKEEICELIVYNQPVEEDCPDEPVEHLYKNWEWVETTGGFGGIIENPDNSGKHINLIISKNEMRYTSYLNGVLIENFIFDIETRKSNTTQELEHFIINKMSTIYQDTSGIPICFFQPPMYFKIKCGNLYIYDDYVDGYVKEYKPGHTICILPEQF